MSSGTAGAEGAVFEPPFSIPESWAWCRLGDVCEIVLGGTPDTKKTQYWDGDIPWLTPGEMSELKDKYVSSTRRTLSQLGLEKGSRLFPSRSVILSTRAPIGYLFINSVPMSTNQGCKTLVPCRGLLPEYLYYNLLGRVDELKNLGTGTTFKELSSSALSSLCISIPPLAEQIRIVSFFEEISSLCEFIDNGEALFDLLARTAKKRILDLAIRGALVPQDPTDKPASVLLDRIRSTADKPPCPNRMSESFESPFPIPDTWEWTTIREINEYERKTLQPDPGSEEVFELYSVPVFESGLPEFVKGTEISSPKQVVRKGDVLVCKINPRINRVWNVAGHTDSRLLASSEWIVVRAKDIVSGYLKIVFQSPYFRAKLLTNVSGVGGSLMRAQAGFVMDYPFPIPPLAEQRRIVAKVEELFSAIDAMATK